MRTFFDTSALVKLFHEEQGSAEIIRLYDDATVPPLISRLGLVEAQSALMTKVRVGEIDLETFEEYRLRLWREVRSRKLLVVRVRPLHFANAEELIHNVAGEQQLRTLDALQLAIGRSLSENPADVEFVCSDGPLCRVAESEGLRVVNPEQF